MNDCFRIANEIFDFMAVGMVKISGLNRFPIVGFKRFSDNGGNDGFADVGGNSCDE